jgi:hypothetical protein
MSQEMQEQEEEMPAGLSLISMFNEAQQKMEQVDNVNLPSEYDEFLLKLIDSLPTRGKADG